MNFYWCINLLLIHFISDTCGWQVALLTCAQPQGERNLFPVYLPALIRLDGCQSKVPTSVGILNRKCIFSSGSSQLFCFRCSIRCVFCGWWMTAHKRLVRGYAVSCKNSLSNNTHTLTLIIYCLAITLKAMECSLSITILVLKSKVANNRLRRKM